MKDVEIPRSIPKLTTARVLTMSFVEGDPITRLKVFPPACCKPHSCAVRVLQRQAATRKGWCNIQCMEQAIRNFQGVGEGVRIGITSHSCANVCVSAQRQVLQPNIFLLCRTAGRRCRRR